MSQLHNTHKMNEVSCCNPPRCFRGMRIAKEIAKENADVNSRYNIPQASPAVYEANRDRINKLFSNNNIGSSKKNPQYNMFESETDSDSPSSPSIINDDYVENPIVSPNAFRNVEVGELYTIPTHKHTIIESSSRIGELAVLISKKFNNPIINIVNGKSSIPITLSFNHNMTNYCVEFSDFNGTNLKNYSTGDASEIRMAWTTLENNRDYNTNDANRLLFSKHMNQMVARSSVRIKSPNEYSLIENLFLALPYPQLMEDHEFCSIVIVVGKANGSILTTGFDVNGRNPSGLSYLIVVRAI